MFDKIVMIKSDSTGSIIDRKISESEEICLIYVTMYQMTRVT